MCQGGTLGTFVTSVPLLVFLSTYLFSPHMPLVVTLLDAGVGVMGRASQSSTLERGGGGKWDEKRTLFWCTHFLNNIFQELPETPLEL